MKKLELAVAMIFAAGAALADQVKGVWKTKPDDNGNFGYIHVTPCGPAFCGAFIKGFDGSGTEIDSPNVGKKIIWDMVARGDDAYGDGQV